MSGKSVIFARVCKITRILRKDGLEVEGEKCHHFLIWGMMFMRECKDDGDTMHVYITLEKNMLCIYCVISTKITLF